MTSEYCQSVSDEKLATGLYRDSPSLRLSNAHRRTFEEDVLYKNWKLNFSSFPISLANLNPITGVRTVRLALSTSDLAFSSVLHQPASGLPPDCSVEFSCKTSALLPTKTVKSNGLEIFGLTRVVCSTTSRLPHSLSSAKCCGDIAPHKVHNNAPELQQGGGFLNAYPNKKLISTGNPVAVRSASKRFDLFWSHSWLTSVRWIRCIHFYFPLAEDRCNHTGKLCREKLPEESTLVATLAISSC